MSLVPTPKIIAHRGASKEAPENTLSAIKRAIALKVDYVEIDVRLSKDGIPLVIHDSSVARMTGIKDYPSIPHLTFSQIQQIDVGQRFGKSFQGEKIPSLSEVLSLDWKQTKLMLEIKKCPQKEDVLVKAIFNILSEMKTLPSIIMGSFSVEIIQEVQQQLKHSLIPIETIGIVEKHEMLTPFIELKMNHIAIWYKLITPYLVQDLTDKKIDLWTFTVDDVNVAKFLISLGVKGIISNDPKTMIEHMRAT